MSGIEGELRCAFCEHEIEDKQAYVLATCTKCESRPYHVWCVEEYVTRRVRSHHTNSRAIQKSKLQAKSKPWKELEANLRCPAGLCTLAGHAAEPSLEVVKNLCPGRITTAELVDKPREKKRKMGGAGAKPGGGAGAGPAQGDTRRPAAAAAAPAGRGMAGAGVSMSLAKAEEFLGIRHEEEEPSEGEGGSGEPGEGPSARAASEEASTASQLLHPGQRPGLGAAAGAGAAHHQQQHPPRAGPASGGPRSERSASHQDFARSETEDLRELRTVGEEEWEEEEALLTREEAEFAVCSGLLPPDYRTRLCSSLAAGAGRCPLGARCTQAHSCEELRVEAGIQLGRLPPDYKLSFCKDWVSKGICSAGAYCSSAHSFRELRVLPAIQAGYLVPGYKTQLCPTYLASGFCLAGVLCGYAHGADELRREAAVAFGTLPHKYKFELCPQHCQAGRCLLGAACQYAHGVKDLRLAAMLRDHHITPMYKTSLCFQFQATGACASGRNCRYAHGEEELLSRMMPHTMLCPIYQETGQCAEGCPFAHSPADLQLPHVAAKVARLGPPAPGAGALPLSEAALAVCNEAGAGSSVGRGGAAAGQRERDWGFTAGAPARSGSSHQGETGAEVSSAYQMYLRAKAAKDAKTSGRQQQQSGGLLKFWGHFRPRELKLCKMHADCGRCYVVNCPYAHGEKELAEREHRWCLAQKEKAEAKRLQDAERRKREAAARGRGWPGWAGGGAGAGGAEAELLLLPFSDAILELMKTHKRGLCVAKLIDLGFEVADANRAADAAGADSERAASLILDGEECCGLAPINVDSEVEALVRFGRHLGFGDEDIEMELVIESGDWDKVMEQLLRRHQDNALPTEEELYDFLSAPEAATSSTAPLPTPLPLPVPIPMPSAPSPATPPAPVRPAAAAAAATGPPTSSRDAPKGQAPAAAAAAAASEEEEEEGIEEAFGWGRPGAPRPSQSTATPAAEPRAFPGEAPAAAPDEAGGGASAAAGAQESTSGKEAPVPAPTGGELQGGGVSCSAPEALQAMPGPARGERTVAAAEAGATASSAPGDPDTAGVAGAAEPGEAPAPDLQEGSLQHSPGGHSQHDTSPAGVAAGAAVLEQAGLDGAPGPEAPAGADSTAAAAATAQQQRGEEEEEGGEGGWESMLDAVQAAWAQEEAAPAPSRAAQQTPEPPHGGSPPRCEQQLQGREPQLAPTPPRPSDLPAQLAELAERVGGGEGAGRPGDESLQGTPAVTLAPGPAVADQAEEHWEAGDAPAAAAAAEGGAGQPRSGPGGHESSALLGHPKAGEGAAPGQEEGSEARAPGHPKEVPAAADGWGASGAEMQPQEAPQPVAPEWLGRAKGVAPEAAGGPAALESGEASQPPGPPGPDAAAAGSEPGDLQALWPAPPAAATTLGPATRGEAAGQGEAATAGGAAEESGAVAEGGTAGDEQDDEFQQLLCMLGVGG